MEQTLNQRFQFGDPRVETPATTVEVESGGRVGNLAKYWPLLATGELEKRLVIIHVFQIGSAGDYIAHRRLWGFLVERMREDFEERGIVYPDMWEARMLTYRRGEEPLEAAELLRATVIQAAAAEELVGRNRFTCGDRGAAEAHSREADRRSLPPEDAPGPDARDGLLHLRLRRRLRRTR